MDIYIYIYLCLSKDGDFMISKEAPDQFPSCLRGNVDLSGEPTNKSENKSTSCRKGLVASFQQDVVMSKRKSNGVWERSNQLITSYRRVLIDF